VIRRLLLQALKRPVLVIKIDPELGFPQKLSQRAIGTAFRYGELENADKPYRRRVGRMFNKGEAVYSLARLVAYGQLGILTDRDLTSQLNRATCLSLLLNVIAVWNTRYMQAALDHLCATGYPVMESDLEHLSPILSGHINLHGGSHHFDLLAPKKRGGQLRPLRTTEPLF
jgi:Tn3 transposase DDE domain